MGYLSTVHNARNAVGGAQTLTPLVAGIGDDDRSRVKHGAVYQAGNNGLAHLSSADDGDLPQSRGNIVQKDSLLSKLPRKMMINYLPKYGRRLSPHR
jgi:hypothetical protein